MSTRSSGISTRLRVRTARRRAAYFDPYHAAIDAQLKRLRARHPRVVLYDAHSIRSHVARLFDGKLPQFNIGTNGGASCDAALTSRIETICKASAYDHVTNGRFRGGWITRHHGKPCGANGDRILTKR